MNVTKLYRKTKYFHIFNIISVKKPLLFNNQNSNENPFINETPSKPKLDSSIKTFRSFRYFVDDLNDFSISFSHQQCIEFAKIFNFFLLINLSTTNSRRQINAISTEKIIYKKLIESLSSTIDIINFSFKQQRIIAVIVRQMLNTQSQIIDFFESIEFQKSQKNSNLNNNNIDDIDK